MSSADDIVAEVRMMCCASCGKPELDDVKLKKCDGCDLVRYCGDACQELLRPLHGEKCKERAAELRDEILFRQPESTHLGDCPICYVPLPIEDGKNHCSHAAVSASVMDVYTPKVYVSIERTYNKMKNVHSVDNLYQQHRKKPTSI